MQFKNLQTKILGKQVEYYIQIDSTQKEIWRRVNNKKIKNGTLIYSDIQTNGIGTHGRIWHTDENNNIAFSFYIETNCNISKLEGITTKIAEILIDVFRKFYNIKVDIKAPNDLMINNKKVGGILTESKSIYDFTKFLVIGIGINTNKMKFSEDIREFATSIKKEYGIEIDRDKIIQEFCNRFEIALEEKIHK